MRARSDRPEIVWVDGAGRVTQIARWTAQPVLVTDSMLDDYVSLHGELNAEYIARRPPELEAELVRLMRERANDTLPYFNELIALPDGAVWVGEFIIEVDPTSYLVFDSGGHLTHRVELPRPMRILDIRPPWLLAVQEDPLDVPLVVLYTVESP
ncbi:MAG: hypothetical protein WEG36_05795 [Gemmatimonadota bacterium]